MEVLVHGMAGGVSGCLAILVWYPLETLRIRYQITDLEENKQTEMTEEEKKIKEEEKNKLKLLKSIQFTLKLVKKEGISCLYNGLSSALTGSILSNMVYFAAYRFWKVNLIGLNDKYPNLYSTITSFLGGVCCSLITNPIWVLNARMSKSKEKTHNMSNWDMIKKIYHDEGLSAFYKGIIPAIIMTINPVIQYTIYEFMRKNRLDEKAGISAMNIILITFVSKLVTTLITYPMLTIKTLFQSNETRTSNELFELIKSLFVKDGLSGLYKGLGQKIVQTLTNAVIVMLSYEKILVLIETILSEKKSIGN